MCISFLYVANKEQLRKAENGKPKLKLLLASNRDEFYKRPTKHAQFWDSDPNILAGRDSVEGGTWLGVTKTGKLALLLNITSKAPERKLKSRGELVTPFLRSDAALRGWTYCSNLFHDQGVDIQKDYGLFNLVTIDLLSAEQQEQQGRQNPETSNVPTSGTASCEVTYLTNGLHGEPRLLSNESTDGFFGFGNNVYDLPYCKVINGRKRFADVVKPHIGAALTEEIIQSLKEGTLGVLKDPARCIPDPNLENRVKGAGYSNPDATITALSSVFVAINGYGTRTHTIIMVDTDNNVDYHEWTLAEPIDSQNFQWKETHYNFKIQS